MERRILLLVTLKRVKTIILVFYIGLIAPDEQPDDIDSVTLVYVSLRGH